MPHKCQFQVVKCSGSDDGYSERELEVHSPTTCGWQSTRFCIYPQEIVLKLREPMRIRKLQILSHQCLISTKIEIFVGNSMRCDCRLGYVALSDNERRAFKARELKSIHLDASGQFIKLLLHKNHVNRYNLYNQVNIVAVNVLADELDTPHDEDNTMANLLDKYVGKRDDPSSSFANRQIHISPMDDIAFDMYQDQETASMIRRLEQKKQQAIKEERYDFAKKLKEVIADLYKVGERLGQYDVEKKRAIEQEDYDLAMTKKAESEKFRMYVYNQLNLQQLLEINPGKMIHAPPPKDKTPTPKVMSPVLPPISSDPEPVVPQYHTPIQTARSPIVEESPGDITQQEDVEDRPLPALSKKGQKEEIPEEEVDTPQGEVEELKEKDAREAAQFIEVFGEQLAKCLFSKQWKYRQECVDTLKEEIGKSEPDITAEHEPKAVTQAVIFALKKVLKDPVFSVYNKSLQLLRDLLRIYIPNSRSGKGELTHAVDLTVPVLITRTGDMAARTRDVAMDMILEIAQYPSLKSSDVIPNLATRQFKTKAQKTVRLYRSRLELIEKLMAVLEIKPSGQGGLTTDSIMSFAEPALSHTNGEVRDAAVKVILELYKKVGAPVKDHLKVDEVTIRKNPLYKHIFDGFDRIDGKPTEAERRAQAKNDNEKAEKEKQEQITALQAQLQALKDMAAQHGVKNEGDDKGAKKAPAKRKSKVEEPVRSPPPVANVDKMCIFCGEQNENFTEEMLDLHYWKSCPVLIRCTYCSHVVEISGLNDHYLSECDKFKFGQCTRCKEAFLLTDLDDHMKQKTCTVIKGDKPNNTCPLCRTTISEGDEAWKEHLMETCQANKKRLEQQQQSSKAPSLASLRSVGRATPGGAARKGAAAPAKPRGRGKGVVAR